MAVPKYDKLFQPLLTAMHQLGGSASLDEQEETVAAILKLTENEISEIYKGNQTCFSYRLAWARTYLKNYGLLENSQRGVWALTPVGVATYTVDPLHVKKIVKGSSKKTQVELSDGEDNLAELPVWEEQLLSALREMSPDAFERLCQRVLRESGFTQVEVTGRSGDGGIDGKGVVRLGGLLSFHVLFQCKRYKSSVSPSVVRDFRGAMMGRADKGLIITTSTFTRDARAEAQRDGATPIDLIDGDALVVMLKTLSVGVTVRQKTIEEVVIDESYFRTL